MKLLDYGMVAIFRKHPIFTPGLTPSFRNGIESGMPFRKSSIRASLISKPWIAMRVLVRVVNGFLFPSSQFEFRGVRSFYSWLKENGSKPFPDGSSVTWMQTDWNQTWTRLGNSTLNASNRVTSQPLILWYWMQMEESYITFKHGNKKI